MSRQVDTAAVAARIRRIRARRKISQRDLSKSTGLAQSRLSRIENDQHREIGITDLALIAESLDTKMETLLYGSPLRDRVMTAARADETSDFDGAIDDVIDRLESIRTIREEKSELRTSNSVFPRRPSESPEAWGRAQANRVRSSQGLASEPLIHLDAFVEAVSGAAVIYFPLGAGTDGLYVKDETAEVAVFAINSDTDLERQRFTLAHELAHFLAGDDQELLREGGRESRSESETAAHAFARHLLLPISAIETVPWNELALASLSWRYQISPHATAIQLKRANQITEAELSNLKTLTARRAAVIGGWITQRTALEHAAQTRRLSPEATKQAVDAWQNRVIGIRSLAKLIGEPTHELQERLTKDGVTQRVEYVGPVERVNLDELLPT